jgi:hypothetical protein
MDIIAQRKQILNNVFLQHRKSPIHQSQSIAFSLSSVKCQWMYHISTGLIRSMNTHNRLITNH